MIKKVNAFVVGFPLKQPYKTRMALKRSGKSEEFAKSIDFFASQSRSLGHFLDEKKSYCFYLFESTDDSREFAESLTQLVKANGFEFRYSLTTTPKEFSIEEEASA